MKLFRSLGVLGSLVLAGLAGCSDAAKDTNSSHAAPGALTVSAGLKQLRFSWAAVPGASSYRVSYNQDGASGFTVVSGNVSTTSYDWNIGAHRINWPKALFMLEACDAGTCLPSASVSAVSLMANTIGYVKASNAGQANYFGVAVALSGDGNTLAVGANKEASSSTGINSTPDILAADAGAVYVYTRSGATWVQQAYLKASNTAGSDNFGGAVALSADGNTLAVGAQAESSANTGVMPGAPTEAATLNGAPSSGAVYVFTRSGTTWAQQAYVKASNTEAVDLFGNAVTLSADGNTLAVGAYFEDGMNTGVTGDAPDKIAAPNGAGASGAVYVYIRNGTTWAQQAYVKASNTGVDDQFGISLALSADGTTLAVGAYAEDSAATGINGDQADGCAATPVANCASFSGAVYVFTRSSTIWSQQAYVKASNTGASDAFGNSVSLSADGNTLAIGASGEGSANTGVTSGAPNEASTGNGASSSGAAYVFIRSALTWSQQAYVKASNPGTGDALGFAIALSGDGNTLAVGAFDEDSAKTGITPGAPDAAATPDDVNSATSGAVYAYTRSATAWSQQSYVKATNTGNGDYFGRVVALSADGNTLAAGAFAEASAATGVNNTTVGQSDNTAPAAGAVYLY